MGMLRTMAGSALVLCIMLLSFRSIGGAPIMGPDMNTCKKQVSVPPHNTVVSCCPPLPRRPIKDFKFEDQTLPFRVRRPAHKVDAEYIEKYNRAYELMKALPEDDPRSFYQQSNIHCAYCGYGFKQLGSNITLEMHGTWLTFPFHRWLVYFHERILASLLNDPTFALPFWNWDSMMEPERPAQIPEYFYSQPALNHLRNPKHRSPAIPDLSTDLTGSSPMENRNASVEELMESNNNLMYQTVVSGATLPSLFMGEPLRAGVEKVGNLGARAFEVGPHGAIHAWLGDSMQPRGEDIVHLYSGAARDPVFYSHHANCDRLWNVWKTLPGGKRTGFESDSDWMESELLFYDENADLVRVKVKDSLDIEKLRYTYEEIDNPWARYDPLKSKSTAAEKKHETLSSSVSTGSSQPSWMSLATGLFSSIRERFGSTQIRESGEGTKAINFSNNAHHVHIPRDQSMKATSARRALVQDSMVAEEVLILENIQSPSGKLISFDIFMDIDADESTSTADANYVATYNNMPLRSDPEEQRSVKVTFPIAIGMKLRSLGLEKQACVHMSLVPKPNMNGDTPNVTIERILIEYVLA